MASPLRRNYFDCSTRGIIFLLMWFALYPAAAYAQYTAAFTEGIKDKHGAVIKMPGNQKVIFLLFSAHDFGEGGRHIAKTLKKNRAGGSFFFTGDFFRDKKNKSLIRKLKRDSHYIGVHSDKHLLYNDWTKRDSLLVTKAEFTADLVNSFKELQRFGIKKYKWFLPPYEWYNDSIVKWSAEEGLAVINFTPGTGTNADYTYPGMNNYRSSRQLLDRLYNVEKKDGLSGYLLLIHLGTDPRRTDKFYFKLDEIIKTLKSECYRFGVLPKKS